jgi:hypothetical protein
MKSRVVLVALEALLCHAHRPVAQRLVDARLHGEPAQRLHLARADLEDGVAREGRAEVHLRRGFRVHLVWHVGREWRV